MYVNQRGRVGRRGSNRCGGDKVVTSVYRCQVWECSSRRVCGAVHRLPAWRLSGVSLGCMLGFVLSSVCFVELCLLTFG